MNLVMHQFLDAQLVESEVEEYQTNEPKEMNDETTMVLWDWVPALGMNEEEPTKEIQVSFFYVTTRSKVPIMDESLVL